MLSRFLAVLTLALFVTSSWAAPGDLDTSFGGGKGWMSTGFQLQSSDNGLNSAVQQADGKLVAAGYSDTGNSKDFMLLRYNADGALDDAFGTDGKVTTAIGSNDVANSVIQQMDGKLVAAGYARVGSGASQDFALVRYNANGTLDTDFGNSGKVTTAIGTSNDEAYSVIQQADGKLVAAGSGYIRSGSGYEYQNFVLVRYNANGTLDTGFGTGGKVITAVGSRNQQAYSLIQQADGKLVAAGYVDASPWRDFALVRYNADGSLDTSFGTDGKVTTAIGTINDEAYSVIQQADGKLVAAGTVGNNFALVRYNTDGSLDTSFGTGGKVTTNFTGSSDDEAFSVIQQADGKLVAAGNSDSGNDNFALVRYNTDGSLDSSFGTGGKVTTPISSEDDTAKWVLQQADGKLVAVGNNITNSSGWRDVVLVRYNLDGALDATFNTSGKVIVDSFISSDESYSVIQQADGKLVAVGSAITGNFNYDFALARYNPDGTLDAGFGAGGKITTDIGAVNDRAYTVIQQADGKLVAAGSSDIGSYSWYSDDEFVLVRYNANGTLDTSFGTGGKVITAFVGSSNDFAQSVIQQADGKLVAAGHSRNDADGNEDFALVRYNTDGTLDTSFGTGGKVTTGINNNDQAYSVIQQADGKLVAVGYSNYDTNDDFALVRYNSNGSLDTTFNGTGKLTTAIGASSDYAYSVIQQADGKLVAAGYSYNGSNFDFALVRYNSDGTLDTTFNGTGKLTTAIGATDDLAYSVIQQADGKLVAAGYSRNYGIGNDDFALVRYNSNGSLDTTFNVTGKLTAVIGAATDRVKSMIQQTDGKLAVAGYSSGMPTGQEFVVARFESGQPDTDGDGYIDGLDTDDDNDGVADISDVFPLDATESVDTDSDGIGDNADATPNGDTDNDGIDNLADNCVTVSNIDQLNTDGDSEGNACDTDDDNDGVADISDAFPLDATESVDTDGDGIGNNTDTTPNGDTDNDGIDNAIDNCVSVSNTDQLNTDGDSEGNECDNDDDNDGVADASDAFPLDATESVDTDSDTVGDNTDNCVAVANTNQLDTDADGAGDVCDATPNGDTDNDGIDNATDNCVSVSNTDQLNTDGDSEGNECDSDDDNDGVADSSDAFPLDGTESVDTDSDTVGDNADNCIAVVNTDQLDTDTDGAGDVCDNTPNGDTDNDGIDNLTDNCVSISNADQLNTDGDAQGDACDSDDDNDSVQDGSDNCPLIANSNQLDYDADNIGDACDEAVPLPEDIAGVMKNAKAGSAVAFAGDVNGDGYGDYVIGMPGYDIPAVPPVKIIKGAGRAEVISGKTGAVLMSVNGVAAKDAMGFAVAGNGDIDNDGFDDVLVGAPNADDFAFGLADAGSATILFGPNGNRTRTFFGNAKKSLSGSAVALADVNGDNHADMIVGAPKADDVARSLVDAGNVTVISGNGYSVLNTLYVAKAKANAGTSVAAGDINNDGKADIIIGAPNDDDAANKLKDAGSVSVYDISGTELLRKYGVVANAHFGKSVASGDVNHDGVDDVLVGAPDDDNGKIKDVGSVTVFSGSDASPLIKKFGAVAKANLGNSVTAGDVNGDVYADIIAGAWKDDSPTVPKALKDAGSVSVWSGNGYTLINTLYGDAANDYFGAAVSAGDINSDGNSDLIIGIPGFGIVMKDAGGVTVLSGVGL